MLNYRNKSVFGLDTYINNNISSKISINLGNFLVNFKKKHSLLCFKNATIRNDEKKVLIKIDVESNSIDAISENIKFSLIDGLILVCNEDKYILESLNIQLGTKIFTKNDCIKVIYGNDHILFNLHIVYISYKFYIGCHNYFQINNHELPNLYMYIYELCKNIKVNKIICVGDDSGNISMILSHIYKEVIVYIPCEKSYNASLYNLSINNINNIRLYNLGKKYSEILDINNDHLMLINPGRKGICDDNINYINNNMKIKNLIYMSCKPKTLDNDLKKIKFNLISKKSLNMFENVDNYCENVVLLKSDKNDYKN